jgi:hypothetical protein
MVAFLAGKSLGDFWEVSWIADTLSTVVGDVGKVSIGGARLAIFRWFTSAGGAIGVTDDFNAVQWFSLLDLEVFLASAMGSVSGSDGLGIGNAGLAVVDGGSEASVAVCVAEDWSACTGFQFEFIGLAFGTLVLVWTGTGLAGGIANIWLAVQWVVASLRVESLGASASVSTSSSRDEFSMWTAFDTAGFTDTIAISAWTVAFDAASRDEFLISNAGSALGSSWTIAGQTVGIASQALVVGAVHEGIETVIAVAFVSIDAWSDVNGNKLRVGVAALAKVLSWTGAGNAWWVADWASQWGAGLLIGSFNTNAAGFVVLFNEFRTFSASGTLGALNTEACSAGTVAVNVDTDTVSELGAFLGAFSTHVLLWTSAFIFLAGGVAGVWLAVQGGLGLRPEVVVANAGVFIGLWWDDWDQMGVETAFGAVETDFIAVSTETRAGNTSTVAQELLTGAATCALGGGCAGAFGAWFIACRASKWGGGWLVESVIASAACSTSRSVNEIGMWGAGRALFITFTVAGLAWCVASCAGEWLFLGSVVGLIAMADVSPWFKTSINELQDSSWGTGGTVFSRGTTASNAALITVPWSADTSSQVSIFPTGIAVGVLWSVAGLAGLVAGVFLANKWVFRIGVEASLATAGCSEGILNEFSIMWASCALEVGGTVAVETDLAAFNAGSVEQFLAWSAFCALVGSLSGAFSAGVIAMIAFPWVGGIEVGSSHTVAWLGAVFEDWHICLAGLAVMGIWAVTGSARWVAFSAHECFTFFRALEDTTSGVALAEVLIWWLGGEGSGRGAGLAVESGCTVAGGACFVASDFLADTVIRTSSLKEGVLIVFAGLAVVWFWTDATIAACMAGISWAVQWVVSFRVETSLADTGLVIWFSVGTACCAVVVVDTIAFSAGTVAFDTSSINEFETRSAFSASVSTFSSAC